MLSILGGYFKGFEAIKPPVRSPAAGGVPLAALPILARQGGNEGRALRRRRAHADFATVRFGNFTRHKQADAQARAFADRVLRTCQAYQRLENGGQLVGRYQRSLIVDFD